MTLRRLHASSAALLGGYAAAHVANHLAGLAGIDAHVAVMRALRTVYRAPAVEAVLLAAAAFQAGSGLAMVARGWRGRRGVVAWVQAGSGAYLALFLSFHLGAVLAGRAALHLDTNFYFAAAGLHAPAFRYFFAPYYFLAVLALFTHAGCALHWRVPEHRPRARLLAVAIPAAIGSVVALLLVLMLGGRLYPVVIPPAYRETFAPRARVITVQDGIVRSGVSRPRGDRSRVGSVRLGRAGLHAPRDRPRSRADPEGGRSRGASDDRAARGQADGVTAARGAAARATVPAAFRVSI